MMYLDVPSGFTKDVLFRGYFQIFCFVEQFAGIPKTLASLFAIIWILLMVSSAKINVYQDKSLFFSVRLSC